MSLINLLVILTFVLFFMIKDLILLQFSRQKTISVFNLAPPLASHILSSQLFVERRFFFIFFHRLYHFRGLEWLSYFHFQKINSRLSKIFKLNFSIFSLNSGSISCCLSSQFAKENTSLSKTSLYIKYLIDLIANWLKIAVVHIVSTVASPV